MKKLLFFLTVVVILGSFTAQKASAVVKVLSADEKSTVTVTAKTQIKASKTKQEGKSGNFDQIQFRFFPLVELEINEFQHGADQNKGGAANRYWHWSLLHVPFFHFAGIQGKKRALEKNHYERLEPFSLSDKPDFMVVDCPLFSLLDVHTFTPDRSTVSVLDSPILNIWRRERYHDEQAHYVGTTPLVNLYADKSSPSRSEVGLLDFPVLGWAFRHKATAEKNTLYFFFLHFSYSAK